MTREDGSAYYEGRRAELLASFGEDAGFWRQIAGANYREEFAEAVVQEAREQFEALIPRIPYIGGDENHLTANLVDSTRFLALYSAMKARGKTAVETGRVRYYAIEARSGCPAPPIAPSQRLSPEALQRRRRQRAAQSHELVKSYPDTWVYDFIEGDGEEFDYGYDFLQCATRRFYAAQGAEELLPFYCFLDYAMSRTAGLGLERARTLSLGDDRCTFRFKRGRRTEPGWPPAFLEHR